MTGLLFHPQRTGRKQVIGSQRVDIAETANDGVRFNAGDIEFGVIGKADLKIIEAYRKVP